MRFYAERPARLARQVTADVVVLAWIAVWVWLAVQVREQVLRLRAPGEQLTAAGEGLSGAFRGAAGTAGRVPLVGDELAAALGGGTGAGTALSEAGRSQIEAVGTLASGSTAVIIALAVLPVLLWWLPVRWRYARAAGAAVSVRDRDVELLALRALVELPPRRLLAVGPEPAAAWRSGDAAVCLRLADLQLEQLGLWGARR